MAGIQTRDPDQDQNVRNDALDRSAMDQLISKFNVFQTEFDKCNLKRHL